MSLAIPYPVGHASTTLARIRPGRRVRALASSAGVFATILLLMLATPGVQATGHAAPLKEAGPHLEPGDPLPTLLDVTAFETLDLDHDGADEVLATSRRGVVHHYDSDGDLLWATDIVGTSVSAGKEIAPGSVHLIADYSHRDPYTSLHGIATPDITGDGIDDVVAVARALALETPDPVWYGILLKLDGTNGHALETTFHTGLLTNVLAADLDGDGDEELVVTQEDGPTATRLTGWGDATYGGGDTTKVWAQDPATGTLLWTWDSQRAWAKATAVGTGALTGGGPDIALALTDAYADVVEKIDHDPAHTAQDLVALDGVTGSHLWSAPTDDYVRQIRLTDLDGDLVDDIALRIQESSRASQTDASRGDQAGYVETRSGLDGHLLWSLAGTLGKDPRVYDLDVLPDTPPRLAVSVGHGVDADYPAAHVAEVLVVDGPTGSLDARSDVGRELPFDSIVVPGIDLGLADPATPVTDDSAGPVRLHTVDADGDGRLDLVVKDERGLSLLRDTGAGLEQTWRVDRPTEDHVLVPLDGPDGLRIGVQGLIVPDAGTSLFPDDDHWALTFYDVTDGTAVRRLPLVANMLGSVRTDLDGDGITERITGGLSRTVFAWKSGTTEVLWRHDIGNYITDLLVEDVTGDGVPDIIVVAHQEAYAVDGADGGRLWRYTLVQPIADRTREAAGMWSDVALADLDGDGVRDVVLGFRTGMSASTAFHNTGRVIALDSTTGKAMWDREMGYGINSISLAVDDFDDDGAPEVVTTTTTNSRRYYGLVMLEGATGLPAWAVEEVVDSGNHPARVENLGVVDADGDGDPDLVTVSHGQNRFPLVRWHDGDDGSLIRTRQLEPTFDPTLEIMSFGLATGALGPGGSDGVVVFAAQQIVVSTPEGSKKAWDTLVVSYAGTGELLYTRTYATRSLPTSFDVGDLEGDGIDDVVFAVVGGIVAIDQGPTLAGNPTEFGHMARWGDSRVSLRDIDGDGTAELETMTDSSSWPLPLDVIGANDIAGANHMVGTMSFGSIELPVPNRPPVAEALLLTDPVVEGEPASFDSMSYDPDGTLVKETWSFPDGTKVENRSAEHVFTTPGTHTVGLTVMDDEGATGTASLTVTVREAYAHSAGLTTGGANVAPGATVQTGLTVTNTGVKNDTFSPAATAPHDWTWTFDDPSPVTLAEGESHTWHGTLSVASAEPTGTTTFTVVADTGGDVSERTFVVRVPMVVEVALDRDTYRMSDEVAGTVRVQWTDGTPLADTTVDLRHSGFQGTSETTWTTGADGTFRFTLEPDTGPLHGPGQHSVQATAHGPPGYTVTTWDMFTVRFV